MNYNYNGNLSFEDRVHNVSDQIFLKYGISKEISEKIASLEPVIRILNIILEMNL